MSEDIVKTLRAEAMWHARDARSAQLLEDTADEIKRLRREILHYEHQCELGGQEIERLQKLKDKIRARLSGDDYPSDPELGEEIAKMFD